MALRITITHPDGRSRTVTTSIGFDLLTLFPPDDRPDRGDSDVPALPARLPQDGLPGVVGYQSADESPAGMWPETQQAQSRRVRLHERRMAGLENAWVRKPTQAMRKRMAQQDMPYGVVAGQQTAEYAADREALGQGIARKRAEILRVAECCPRGRLRSNMRVYAAHAQFYADNALLEGRPATRLQFELLGFAYAHGVRIMDQRLREPAELQARVEPEPVRGPIAPWCGECEAYTWCGHE